MSHKKEKYRNWVRGGLAYMYLKAGIQEFADDVVQQQHKHILHTVNNTPGLSCNQCCLRDLQPLHKCEKDPDTDRNRCPWGQNICNCLSRKTKPCTSSICDAIMEEILKSHGSTPPKPNWRNTDVQKWCSSPWEIAKCFIDSAGYSDKSNADDFDAAALLQIFINNTNYKIHLSDKLNRSDALKKTLQRRNELFHSPTMEMEDSKLDECIDEIISILEDDKELKARLDAQEAVRKLKQLKPESFIITVSQEAVVCRAAVTHVTNRLDEMLQLINDANDAIVEQSKAIASSAEEIKKHLGSHHLFSKQRHTIPEIHKDNLDIIRQNYQDQLQCVEENQDNLWMSFISGDIETDLLAEEILPRNDLLQLACTKLGRHSNLVSKICSKISDFIKMSTKDIVDTWAAYEYSEFEKNGETKVIFVVCTTQIRAQIDVRDYIIHQRKINTYSSESQEVLAESIKNLDKDYQPNEISELRKCIATHSDSLMDSHSNLNIISPSLKRSRGYGTASRVISDELCIVLYVDVKGFIPIQEEAFPKQLDGLPTDVWEGGFETFTGGYSNDTHEHMKMGLAIHAYNTNSLGELVGGTLGGFVEHPLHGLCGISCSHVLLSGEEMRKVQNGGQLEIQKKVYHPVCYTSSTQFGKVVSAVFKEESSTAGVDVAMFKIEAKFPLKGDFPDAFNYLESGFDEKNPLLFNSGDVLDVSAKLEGRPEVYKFGIATGITRGSFGLQGSVIRRKQVFEGQWEGFGYRLKNLIEILAIGGQPFAQIGDSGALVMKEGTGGDSVAIGMVQAGLYDGSRVFVSPIFDILKSLGCPLSMKKFNSDSTNSPNMSQRSTSPMQTDV